METERDEVYERIPWETLDRGGGDRQWLIIALAGAVAVGALAFSFMRGQPAPAPMATPSVEPSAPALEPSVPAASAPTMDSPSPTVASPLVVAEADLYAADSEHLVALAAAHAEWFAIEYLSVDGSDQSRQTLVSLLPEGIPLPEAPEAVQVFVDWAGARAVTEIAPLEYEVEVLVRSLLAQGDGGFIRQQVTRLEVAVVIGDDGLPRVSRPPRLLEPLASAQSRMPLSPVPEPIKSQVESSLGAVVGGLPQPDGTWLVVAMVTGPDGVTRPVTVTAP
jgi:hypothetical protein